MMDFEAAKAVCRGFAGSTEDIKWGADAVFSVGGKMFAVAGTPVAGTPVAGTPVAGIPVTGSEAPASGISFKVEDERFLELTDRPGIIPAPYLARARWVKVDSADALSDDEAAALLRRSYELVFAKLTKKLQRELGGEA
jgi:predicted DNA-binding protein (MmcQ/YjbR family)